MADRERKTASPTLRCWTRFCGLRHFCRLCFWVFLDQVASPQSLSPLCQKVVYWMARVLGSLAVGFVVEVLVVGCASNEVEEGPD